MAEARADEPENVAEVAKTDSTVVEEELDVDLEALAKDFAALFRVDTTTKVKSKVSFLSHVAKRILFTRRKKWRKSSKTCSPDWTSTITRSNG